MASVPAIPAPRPPSSPLAVDGYALPGPHAFLPPPRPAGRRLPGWAGVLIAAIVVVGLAIGAGVVGVSRAVLTRSHQARHDLTATAATDNPSTPYERMVAVLTAQAAAMARGDEAGWLAAVDPGRPKLRARYRTMFRTLQGLGLSDFRYEPGVDVPDRHGVATLDTGVRFCFSLPACPDDTAPMIRQQLTLAPVQGRYVITALSTPSNSTELQPTPWESGDLVLAQGKRVVVAAAPSEARYVKQIVALGDRSAAVTDRFAALVGNPQRRYRIYLADPKSWRTWYGGDDSKTTIGLEVPLGEAESDVVLRMSLLTDPVELARTLQHEMGHVATVGGAKQEGRFLYQTNQWLSEGVAEYIEWLPKGATASDRRSSVRLAEHGRHPPATIAAAPLTDDASDRAVDAFYGLGHFAVDCLVRTYGEAKAFVFVRSRLREGLDLDVSARLAFGQPFAAVDRGCVAWTRAHA